MFDDDTFRARYHQAAPPPALVGQPIGTAPILPGKPFGPVLLLARPWRRPHQPKMWQLGYWDGEVWHDESGGIVAPRCWCAIPDLTGCRAAAP